MEYFVPGSNEDGKLKGVRPGDTTYIKSFLDLDKEGLVPFALGPLYVYAGVQEWIVQRFVNEMGGEKLESHEIKAHKLEKKTWKIQDMRGGMFRFNNPVLTRCEDWNYVLDTLDKETYPHFKQWLLSQQFVNRVEKKFYVPRNYAVPILDPLALEAKGIAVPSSLEVYSLSGMKGNLKPVGSITDKTQTRRFVEFQQLPPEEDVIKLGAAALQIIKEC